MAEIELNEETEVGKFLEKTFGVDRDLALKYAKIAAYMSTDKFVENLGVVDTWLEKIYRAAMDEGAFGAAPGDESLIPKKKTYNVTSRLLNAAANSLGWSTGGSLVMSGFTHPPDFARIVQRKLMWKDMVASGHGEFTHIVQWLVIYTFMYDEAPELYSKACNYFYEGEAFNKKRKAYIWDFVVDCFPTPPESDWRVECKSKTARSPTMANAIIFAKAKFLGGILQNRYTNKGYVVPSDSTPVYTSTTERSHAKHTKPESPPPVALESANPRMERKTFEGAKGYKGLITTGYPKENTPENLRTKKTGYLFARSDQALKEGSTLMNIAQRIRLL
jgi:Family of unknown function (DUF5636)